MLLRYTNKLTKTMPHIIKNSQIYWTGKNHANYKEKIPVICQECGETKYFTPSIAKTRKFCSKECRNTSISNRKKIGRLSLKQDAKYCAIHRWLYRQVGKASNHKCIDCNNQAQEWSNKDHKHKRNIKDYAPRCKKCHCAYDKTIAPVQGSKLVV